MARSQLIPTKSELRMENALRHKQLSKLVAILVSFMLYTLFS